MATLRVGDGRLGDPEAFWSLAEVAQPEHRKHRTPEQAIDALETVLSEAVVSQMVADVPVGAFLSGGVDSSIVVALMQRFNSGKVRTFTIGFDDPSYDESADAARIARHLGTEHTELRLTAADALAVVPDLPRIYDEPFADWSQIPTLLVSRFAREEVTVALSGDGGDELFGGYNRYSLGLALWDRVATVPLPMRRAAGQLIQRLPTGSLDHALELVVGSLPTRLQLRTPGTKLRKLGEVLPSSSLDDLYARLICLWREPGEILLGGVDSSVALGALTAPAALVEPVERMMFSDTVGYLPDDILVKVDRASMAVSLEVRVPMLDRRVVEFAWTLSPDQRLRGRVGKWCLRQLLERYVPTNLMDRPKMGFGLPLGAWLRGPLRGWATSLLDPRRVASEGYLSAEVVDRIWKSHLSGRRDQEHLLWSVLAFEAWLKAEQK
jgi:asparagine synthase (glutamine-hydrolysing)